MGILDQLRNWTPETDTSAGRSDFDDAPASVYRPRVARDMIRTVKGATDLRDAMPQRSGPNPNAGKVIVDGDHQRRDSRPFAGQPSEAQRALIVKLVNELAAVDAQLGEAAARYTVDMTNNHAWTLGREGNASRWISRLMDKIRDAKHTASLSPTAAPSKPAFDAYDDITDGNYAVERAGKTHFYRITRSRGRGQYEGRTFINIQERASDELFPIRGAWAARKSILDSIRDAGVQASHLMYADRLGMCWHCNRTLTDDVHNPYRKYGLGPICGPKMGYAA